MDSGNNGAGGVYAAEKIINRRQKSVSPTHFMSLIDLIIEWNWEEVIKEHMFSWIYTVSSFPGDSLFFA